MKMSEEMKQDAGAKLTSLLGEDNQRVYPYECGSCNMYFAFADWRGGRTAHDSDHPKFCPNCGKLFV